MKTTRMKKMLFFTALFTMFAIVKVPSQNVPDGHIYLLGNDKSGAFYTKDGVRVNLPGEKAWANSMVIENNNIYTAGNYTNNGAEYPCYWINNVLYPLTNVSGSNSASGIGFSNGKIHIVGQQSGNVSANLRAFWYWADGKKVDIPLSPPGSISTQYRMAVFNGTPYIAGNKYLTDGVNSVSGGKTYVAGYDNDKKPCYWVDGKQYFISGEDAWLKAIIVTAN